MNQNCDVLILGSTGMLGSALLRYFCYRETHNVLGTMRAIQAPSDLKEFESHIIGGIDVENLDSLIRLFADYRPKIVINCIGLVKQLAESNNPLICLKINSLLPHRLANLCNTINAKLIHISTDCVFSGHKGMYTESDLSDATDLYGRSKLLGEVSYPNCLTLRTSIIGHEIGSSYSLLEWFLSQEEVSVRGFRKAIFSGLPTVELARVIHDYVLPQLDMSGLFHVSAEPISKYNLLQLIAREYKKNTHIEGDDQIVIDRSLDSTKFQIATGFQAKTWDEMVSIMRDFG